MQRVIFDNSDNKAGLTNIMSSLVLRGLFSLFLFCLASSSYALAGFAESTSQFHYTSEHIVERGHPSDLCQKSKWCLILRPTKDSTFGEHDISFEKLAVPDTLNDRYTVGQRSLDDQWIIYDLQRQQVLDEGIYQQVMEGWRQLGLDEPLWVDAHNTRQLLQETEDSIRFRWSMDLQLWAVFALLPGGVMTLIFGVPCWVAKKRYSKTGVLRYRIFFMLLLLVTLFWIGLTANALVGVILQNW